MTDLATEYDRVRTALNDGEPQGSIVVLTMRATWVRRCVHCQRRVKTAWQVIDRRVVCTACVKHR